MTLSEKHITHIFDVDFYFEYQPKTGSIVSPLEYLCAVRKLKREEWTTVSQIVHIDWWFAEVENYKSSKVISSKLWLDCKKYVEYCKEFEFEVLEKRYNEWLRTTKLERICH